MPGTAMASKVEKAALYLQYFRDLRAEGGTGNQLHRSLRSFKIGSNSHHRPGEWFEQWHYFYHQLVGILGSDSKAKKFLMFHSIHPFLWTCFAIFWPFCCLFFHLVFSLLSAKDRPVPRHRQQPSLH